MTHETAITKNGFIFAAAIGATLLLAWTLIAPFIDVVVYAIFAYYITRPIYKRVESRVKSPILAAFTSLFIVILPMTLVGLYVLGVSYLELANFLKSTGFPYMDRSLLAAEGYATELSKLDLQDAAIAIVSNRNIQSAAAVVWSLGLAASWALIRVLPSLLLAQYLLTDGGKFIRWLVSCAPKDSAELVKEYVREVDFDLEKFFTGSIVSSLVIGLIAALVFSAINIIAAPAFQIPYPLLCALLCGLASLTPLVGAGIFYYPLTAVFIISSAAEGRLGQQFPYIALFFAATFAIVDWGPNILLKPKLTIRKIPSMLMLLAFIFGPAAYGLSGLFLGPMVLVILYQFCRIFLPKLRG